jgi:electron transfer flavoprotein beta subunit
MDEYAIEEALRVREAHGGEVTILTMGPVGASESIRKALSLGPDRAVHVLDGALHGSCALVTSKILAAALGTLNPDLVLCGAESTAEAPAIVSVWDTINEPRYPSFKGIMAAKKKPVQTLSLADLGIAPDEVGFDGATSAVVEHSKRPLRSGGQKVTDEGDGGVKLVEFLASEKFV